MIRPENSSDSGGRAESNDFGGLCQASLVSDRHSSLYH